MNKFWNWKTTNKVDETTGETITERELRIEGIIASESWFDDDVTPKMFRDELNSGNGNITVWINSYGGDVFAGSQIYTMLKEYKGNVAVKIDGIAASAASVIAMGGDTVSMSPTACMMIHDPSSSFFFAVMNIEATKELLRQLNSIKDSIVHAYELKTNLTHDKISKLMTDETMMSASQAVELGFADEILYSDKQTENVSDGVIFSNMKFTNCLVQSDNRLIEKINNKIKNDKAEEIKSRRVPIDYKKLYFELRDQMLKAPVNAQI